MKVESLMTRNVTCVAPDDSLKQAFDLMQANGIRHLPVVLDNNILVGILSDRDIFLRAKIEDGDLDIPDVEVKSAMTSDVITCRASHDMSEIAGIMLERKIDSIPITDAFGELTGIITSSDFVEYVARRPQFDSGSQRTIPFHFMINRFRSGIRPADMLHGNPLR